ncbi:acylneuraminate cytidylyltransferase family protein, partial [Gammaproteobacteria bacterium]|nr:acylneuraminate cytidylyltransferase family protein [Gammaproteobacteria bacterium]
HSLEKIFVSSDDNSILEIASKEGVTCIERPANLAEDWSSMESVIMHSIEQIDKQGVEFKYLILLQPTSPLRDSNDIDLACKKFIQLKADSLISVTNIESSVLKTLVTDNDGFLRPAFDDKFPSMNRQQLPLAYKPNGAIYIIDKKLFLDNPTLFQKNTVMYEMKEDKSIDVDSVNDIHTIEKLNLI